MPIRSFLSVALVAALLATLVAGCGGKEAATSEPAEPDEHATSSAPDHEPEHEEEPASDIGHAFVGFVRGGAAPPMSHQVDLFLGNALTGVVTPGLAADQQAWATCTEVGHYAARSCPISPLRVLKHHRRIEYADAATSDCLKTYGPLPKALRKLDRVVIGPADGSVDGCIDDFAVQLFADDEGRLVAVSTLLGEP